MKSLTSRRPEGCLSDFAIDCHLAGELEPAVTSSAQAHLATCQRCGARVEERLREREAFARDAPALLLRAPKRVAPPAPRRMLARAGGILALAAAILLFITFREPHEGDATRAKGGAAKLGFYVSHGGSVRPGGPAERVLAGDGLRFVVTARDSLYLAVLSIDGARHGSVYYSAGNDAARVSAGNDVPLPVSTTLDDTLGDETIYGVFCPRPFAVEPLRLALEAHPDHPPALEGCTLDVLLLRKEARPPP